MVTLWLSPVTSGLDNDANIESMEAIARGPGRREEATPRVSLPSDRLGAGGSPTWGPWHLGPGFGIDGCLPRPRHGPLAVSLKHLVGGIRQEVGEAAPIGGQL